MSYTFTKQKNIARCLLLIWVLNLFTPSLSYALTSGPSQPETKGFQQAGVSDMVDIESGSFKYNIPLLDIDGYPLNLNYQSGVGMDDESSWVGLGWSLNPGAINRQLRGIPDDFSGDLTETDHYTKPKVTVGAKLTAKVENFGKAQLKGRGSLNGSFTFGVFSDNYTGIGAELGVNAGISFSSVNDGFLTAGLGLGVLSNTQTGADFSTSPYLSMSIKEQSDIKTTQSAGLSGSLGYNSRSGLKNLSLGTSFGLSGYNQNDVSTKKDDQSGGSNYSILGSSISYNTEPISPSIQVPYQSRYGSFSFDVGVPVFGIYGSLGGTGYQNTRSVREIYNKKPAFGFLYAERGKNNPDAVMDFIREKDNPIVPGIPNLALPIHTPDLWSYSSQASSGQFRLYRGGTGAFFDNQAVDNSTVSTTGGDAGFGAYVHGGYTKYEQTTSNTTRKWKSQNNYLAKGDFQDATPANPAAQHVYFRQIGEKSLEDQNLTAQVAGTQPLEVSIGNTNAVAAYKVKGSLYGNTLPAQKITKADRRRNQTAISYLTAEEAAQGALSKTIDNYPFYDVSGFQPPINHKQVAVENLPRVDQNHQKHHFSEMMVTDNSGKRMVYGIPVYNYLQDEYTFAVGQTAPDPSGSNLVDVPPGVTSATTNDRGIDHYYHKEGKPAYATSFLLTSILSPDYQDKTGDGISDDDLGTAIKMNYSKLPYAYKWRAPYQRATLNKGLLADPDDDKGSIIYGEKEIWYISTMESKTKIAYFITQDRQDALGVTGWLNGGADNTNKQKCLKEIRLYSKADMTRPIKVVKFEYSYELCKNVPNSTDLGSSDPALGGKLTLKKVWFEYGNADKGKYHPYTFTYNKTSSQNPDGTYQYMSTDRWGTYKNSAQNHGGMDNEQFPYSSQDKIVADQNVSLWNLAQVSLPTGGQIDVNYESGDYAYVQNKKAMSMVPVRSLIEGVASNDNRNLSLTAAKGIRVDIPDPGAVGADPTKWFKDRYLNGSDYIYTKLYVKISTPNSSPGSDYYDYVPTYCKIASVNISGSAANIIFSDIVESKVTANPISIAAWQRQKNEYPRFAYPGFDNRVQSENSSVTDAVSAIVNAAKNLSELKKNYYQKAKDKGYASEVNLDKSFVKLVQQDGKKLGGTARVKSIRISDSWAEMSGSAALSGAYGQDYDYTTIENGQRVSSGVATYEPSVGNDENALKQPVPYMQKIKGAINNYFSLEEPFGESLYPAAMVGYSKVTVRDLDRDHNPSEKTGYLVNEYYTAKDFPVKVTVLPIINNAYKPASYFSLTSTNSIDELTLSQGYAIELNDMHGKAKAVRAFNQGGSEISSTIYYYKTSDSNGSGPTLDNRVDVLGQDGVKIANQVIGRDIEFFTDFREQESKNRGTAINIGIDVIPFFPLFGLPFLPLPHFPTGGNNDYKLFRSACAVKVVQSYGIMSRVVKTVNGSSITTQNIAYDALTGETVVSSTQNEFGKNIYSVNLPAYWAYKGMGSASQNLGMLYSQLQTDQSGAIQGVYSEYFHPGDEFIDVTSAGNAHYWVTETPDTYSTILVKRVIDREGNIQKGFNPKLVKIVRSGLRNILDASINTVVCLENPFENNGQLSLFRSTELTTALKIINASAMVYDEQWSPELVCNNVTTAPRVENTSLCFLFCTGSPMSAYNSSGTRLQSDQTSNNQYTYLSSPLWGGVSCTGAGAQFARMRTLAVRDTMSADTTAGTVKPRSFALRTNVSVPTTEICGRSQYNTSASNFSCWPLQRSGIWLCQGFSGNGTGFDSKFDEPMGFDTCITVPTSKTYYFGYGGDNSITIAVDNQQVASDGLSTAYYYWTVVPVALSAGKHLLHVEFFNRFVQGDPNSNNPAIAGLEIYNNTAAELSSAQSEADLNRIFTTADLRGKSIQSFRTVYGNRVYHYTNADGSPIDLCSTTSGPQGGSNNKTVNPYLHGYLGNWRPYQSLTHLSNRKYNQKTDAPQKGLDLKNAGYIDNFKNYWVYDQQWKPSGHPAWTVSNTITLYDKYGQQLENRDALGRYSAAKFDFNGELPSAVASNAYNREIYVNSFEDTRFKPGTTDTSSCNKHEFITPSTGQNVRSMVTNAYSHSGNYSALLPNEGLILSTISYRGLSKTAPYFSLDADHQFLPVNQTGVYPKGFEPVPGKKYLVNVWVKDGHAGDKSVNLGLSVNGTSINLVCKAVVEDWKLMEGLIDLSSFPEGAVNIRVSPVNGATVYVDDLRIHPNDSQLKSYAYDDKTMRLMAEIDENGFATFYEYDDEGLLIRVKKETERGIMTLKENRSSYRQKL